MNSPDFLKGVATTDASIKSPSSVYTHKIEIPGDGEYVVMMRDDGGHDLLRRLRDTIEEGALGVTHE